MQRLCVHHLSQVTSVCSRGSQLPRCSVKQWTSAFSSSEHRPTFRHERDASLSQRGSFQSQSPSPPSWVIKPDQEAGRVADGPRSVLPSHITVPKTRERESKQITKASQNWDNRLQKSNPIHAIEYTEFLKQCVKDADFGTAEAIMAHMLQSKKVVPNLYHYNTFMRCAGACSLVSKLEAIFEEMQTKGLKPDVFSYSVILKSYARYSPSKCSGLYAKLLESGVKPDRFIYGNLMEAYLRLGDLRSAESIREAMAKNGVNWDDFTLGFYFALCYRQGEIDRAQVVLEEAKLQGVKPSLIVYNEILSYYAKEGNEEKAMEAANNIFNNPDPNIKPDSYTFTHLVELYSVIGKPALAMQVVDEKMPAFNIRPTLHTYTALCGAMASVGDIQGCLAVIRRMRKQNIDPDLHLFNILIDACARNTSNPEKNVSMALAILADMKKSTLTKFRPDTVTYTSMIHVFAEAGDTSGAFVMLKDMLESGLTPNEETFGALLWACAKAGDSSKAVQVTEGIRAVGLDLNARQYYMLLGASVKESWLLLRARRLSAAAPFSSSSVPAPQQAEENMDEPREFRVARFSSDASREHSLMMTRQLYAEMRSKGIELDLGASELLLRVFVKSDNDAGLAEEIFNALLSRGEFLRRFALNQILRSARLPLPGSAPSKMVHLVERILTEMSARQVPIYLELAEAMDRVKSRISLLKSE